MGETLAYQEVHTATEGEALMIRFTIACVVSGVAVGYAVHRVEARRGRVRMINVLKPNM